MTKPEAVPYGSWKSPITSEMIVAELIGLGGADFDGQDIYWSELHPKEGGRIVVVRETPDGSKTELTPSPFNARTRVHEYGGHAYLIDNGRVYFSNFTDQQLYRQDPGSLARPITPELALRYADYVLDRRRSILFCVREDHTASGEAVNTLVKVKCDGDERGGEVIVAGNNFYSSPRLSPDGSRLAWLTWNHPNMPWDGTELWAGELDKDGSIIRAERVAGGLEESIFQPEWSPDGILYFVSDQTGWWNLYRWQQGSVEALCPIEAEFGQPQWVFGRSTYDFESAGRLICTYIQRGVSHLASLDTLTLKLEEIETPYQYLVDVRATSGRVLFTAGSPAEKLSINLLDLNTRQIAVLRRASETQVDPGYISIPQEIEFPTEGGLTAYGFFYPPHNKDFAPPQGEKPPLLVMSHGGPTGATVPVFDEETQYWTSRGIAVLDVNYGGSTGYGRAYRQRLNGQWGVVDVDDCVNGARYLAERGEVDGDRLMITGGSAGGYTTICALTFRDTFKAGASHFGIGDLETFVKDTHKFESRYLDTLVGPYPDQRDLYRERSPIHFADRLNCPLILFQGSEDKIVPPDQSRKMYAAAGARGLPVAYLEFEGEQHGFRRAENIKRALDAELYFYSRVFGFELADPVEPVAIENL
ncbi:MAG TPA: S9 family peptidase [Anaerolineales bacterium]|nr:S9 family peptidase [Anaerolineales bacterium]